MKNNRAAALSFETAPFASVSLPLGDSMLETPHPRLFFRSSH